MKKDEVKNVADVINPINIDFNIHDLLQVIIGASILAVPVGFTEETWQLGKNLPLLNIFLIMIVTLMFISVFTYFHYHRHHLMKDPKQHILKMIKRVFITYIFSFAVVAMLLAIIQVTPWSTDTIVAFKRVVIVTLPSAIGAAITDTIR